MYLIIKTTILVMLSIFTSNVLAVEVKPMEGFFSVTPKYYIDPEEGEKNTHFRVIIKGESAQELYKLMESKIEKDQCTGAKSKTIESMQCFNFENERGYECHFSIDVENQKIDFGYAC